MIKIRMTYGEEHKFDKIWLYPGFVQVNHGENSRLYPYQQIKHITYPEKKYIVSCGDNGGIALFPDRTTEKKAEVKPKKPVAKKKK